MAKIDDVKTALAAELEAQKAQPDNPTIAASIADLESELAQLEAAAETPKPPPVEPPKAPPQEAPPAAPVAPPAPPAPPVAPVTPEAPHAAPIEHSDAAAIQPSAADHPSRLPPAARPHGFAPGNVRA